MFLWRIRQIDILILFAVITWLAITNLNFLKTDSLFIFILNIFGLSFPFKCFRINSILLSHQCLRFYRLWSWFRLTLSFYFFFWSNFLLYLLYFYFNQIRRSLRSYFWLLFLFIRKLRLNLWLWLWLVLRIFRLLR